MTTLFNATLQLATRLGAVRVSTATGGSTTTVVDTVARTESDDSWNGGTVWIIDGSAGATDAPTGEWARVTDFVNSTSTLTIEAVTAAVGATDTYAVASGRYPLDVLRTAINNELVRYKIPLYDTTSLDVIANQSEYTLPAGIYYHNLRGVYEGINDDSNDNRWAPVNFHVLGASSGSQHTLVIDSRNVTVGNDLMLEYVSELTPLYTASSTIDPIIDMDLILDAAAFNAEVIRQRTYASGNDLDMEMMKWLREDAQIARMKHPNRLPQKRGKVSEAHV